MLTPPGQEPFAYWSGNRYAGLHQQTGHLRTVDRTSKRGT